MCVSLAWYPHKDKFLLVSPAFFSTQVVCKKHHVSRLSQVDLHIVVRCIPHPLRLFSFIGASTAAFLLWCTHGGVLVTAFSLSRSVDMHASSLSSDDMGSCRLSETSSGSVVLLFACLDSKNTMLLLLLDYRMHPRAFHCFSDLSHS